MTYRIAFAQESGTSTGDRALERRSSLRRRPPPFHGLPPPSLARYTPRAPPRYGEPDVAVLPRRYQGQKTEILPPARRDLRPTCAGSSAVASPRRRALRSAGRKPAFKQPLPYDHGEDRAHGGSSGRSRGLGFNSCARGARAPGADAT
jgi:hypothetical protein